MSCSFPGSKVPVGLKLYPAVWDCGQAHQGKTATASVLATIVPLQAPLESRHQMSARAGQIFWTPSTLRSRSMRALIQPVLVFLEQLGISTPRQCGYAMTPVRARPTILSLTNVVLQALPITRVQGVAANLSNRIGLSGGRPCIRPAHYVAHHIAVSRESASGAFEVPFSALFATQCGAPSRGGCFSAGSSVLGVLYQISLLSDFFYLIISQGPRRPDDGVARVKKEGPGFSLRRPDSKRQGCYPRVILTVMVCMCKILVTVSSGRAGGARPRLAIGCSE